MRPAVFRTGWGVYVMAAACLRMLAADNPPSAGEQIRATLEQIRPGLTELRHDLHRHPEASGEEKRTSEIVGRRLRALNLEVRTKVGGHGVVGLLRGGKPGAVVAYRADMDAIRTDQADPAPFRSETPGVRHICGHDVHTTVALGVAEAMASIRDRLPGTIKFIFQPAEETIQGAQAMIREGVLEQPRPGAIYAKAKRTIFDAVTAARTDQIHIELDYTDRRLPDAINDRQLIEASLATLRRILGEQGTIRVEDTVPYFGEDFAFFQKEIPGALLWLGVSNPERGIIGIPHTPNYQADDGAIFFGAWAMANLLTDYLEQHRGQPAGR